MNRIVENYKKELLKEFNYEKVYISKEDFLKLYKESGSDVGIEKDGEWVDISKDKSILTVDQPELLKIKYFKKTYPDISDEEFENYLKLANFDYNKRILNNIRILNDTTSKIHNIMLFWFVLSLLNIAFMIYLVVKISEIIK